MNKQDRRQILGLAFVSMAGVIALGNLWALLVTGQPAPFPPISAILGVWGLILTFWRND